MNKLNYSQIARKYRSDKIRTLLVGEAPPPSGDKYFYLPMELSKASLENNYSLPATIFGHYFGRKPNSKNEYESFLNELCKRGIFLVDLIDEPIRIRDRSMPNQINLENLEKLKSQIPLFREKLSDLKIFIDDENIIFLLPRIKYSKEIKTAFPNSKRVRWKKFRMRT